MTQLILVTMARPTALAIKPLTTQDMTVTYIILFVNLHLNTSICLTETYPK